ncbi:oxidoreductase [Lithospermum erythrorhizon]|uniref:Oxidoreductase n=1 Tax=Lithospermum erythrorhizon TaxID=34254 RepID=A0AAV3RGV0_LITER
MILINLVVRNIIKVFEFVFSRNVVSFDERGEADVLKVERRAIPTLKNDQVLIKVAATTVTTLDVNRRKFLNPNDGLHKLLGMECSGEIVDVGSSVRGHCVHDKVCALLEGGGYAEYVAVESWRVLPIPNGIRLDEAATLPYATSVVWHALFKVGKLKDGCSILVHAGAGELGQLAIQLALLHGCTVFASETLTGERQFCKALGVDCIRHDEHFFDSMLEKTEGRGVDLIFDGMGFNVPHNLKILSRGGMLIITSFCDVRNVPLDLGLFEKKQIKLSGFVFHYMPDEEKKKIIEEIFTHVWPSFESGKLVQKVNKRRYTFSEAPEAHATWQTHPGDRILLIPTMSPFNKRKMWWWWF